MAGTGPSVSWRVSRDWWGMANLTVAPLTIAIVNSARKRVEEFVPHFGHLIVDECHRVPASLFTDVVSRFDCHYLSRALGNGLSQ